jgi:hypothetical protein
VGFCNESVVNSVLLSMPAEPHVQHATATLQHQHHKKCEWRLYQLQVPTLHEPWSLPPSRLSWLMH